MAQINIPSSGLWGSIASALNTMFGELFGQTSSNVINVKQASDFGTIDSTKIYKIDGVIDMTGVTIDVPAQGIYIIGLNTDVSVLTCADNNYTMFNGTNSGNVFIKDVTITTSGLNSQVFGLVNQAGTDAFELNQVNFTGCTSIGELTGFRQGLEVNTSRFGGTPQLTLSGAWSGGYLISTSIVRGITAGVYSLFSAGVSFVMQSRFRTNQNIDLPNDVSIADFAPVNFPNPSTLQLSNMIVTRNGVIDSADAGYLPNISPDNLSCAFKDNTGIGNTFEGGNLRITTQAETTIPAVNTFVDVAGTWTADDLQHFSSPVNGQIRHDGVSPSEYKATVFATIDGGAGDNITVKLVKFDASEGTFVDMAQQTRPVQNALGGQELADFALLANIPNMATNDYLKLQVANATDATNVTFLSDTILNVEVR